MKPIAFKVRGGGNYSGTKGGAVKPNEKGGAGYLGYEDKTFTIATSPDQWICTMKPIISPTITTCKGSRGGCSDEALEEIKAVHAAREQQNLSSQPIPMNEPAQPTTVGKPLRYLSVCSGMEAASVAWHPLGWQPVAFSEIEAFPSAILKHHFSKPNYPYDVPNLGSLTEYQSWPIEQGAIDLLVGGTPCQSFSVAGLRKGLADPRGNLALTFLGLADRLKPKWIVWENVPGVLSSGGGRDFGSFLGALVELGYGFAYRVLDAQYFGVPQRRRRVFVVACLGDWRAPAEVLSLREGLRGYLEAGGKKRKGPAADAGSGVEASGLPIWRAGDQANAEHMIDHAGTVSCNKGSHGGFIAKPVVIDRAAFNQGQNAQYEPHIEETEVMDSLVARGPHAVGQPIPIQDGREIEKNQNGMGVGNPGDPAYTIDTTGAPSFIQPFSVAFGGAKLEQTAPTIMANGGPNRHGEGSWSSTQFTGVIQPTPFRKSKRAASTTDNETWVPADVTNTLNNFDLGDTRTTHAVVEPFIIKPSELRLTGKITPQNICPTLTAGAKQGDSEPCAVQHVHCSDVAPTVTSSGPPYSRTGNERVEAEALAITFQPGNLRREAGAEPSTTTTTTLKASAGDQTPHVAYAFDGYNQTVSQTSQTIRADKSDCDHIGMVATQMAVRRLTPVECERLQGFPDNWSRIPWKGKPETECPDGPRYKACGNSMAVPVMRWIGERIAAVEASSHA